MISIQRVTVKGAGSYLDWSRHLKSLSESGEHCLCGLMMSWETRPAPAPVCWRWSILVSRVVARSPVLQCTVATWQNITIAGDPGHTSGHRAAPVSASLVVTELLRCQLDPWSQSCSGVSEQCPPVLRHTPALLLLSRCPHHCCYQVTLIMMLDTDHWVSGDNVDADLWSPRSLLILWPSSSGLK